MGKAANNEVRKIRAGFFNNLSVGCTIFGIAAMHAPMFLPSMRDMGWRETLVHAYPILILFVLAWSWNSKAKRIAGETED